VSHLHRHGGLYGRLPQLLELLLTDKEPHNRQSFGKLACEVSYVGDDSALCQAVEVLRWRSQVFDRLREAMRIAPPNSGNGLNDEGTDEDISTIRQGVDKFRGKLEKDPKLSADTLARKMAEQIDKYKEKLFADPITVDTPNGPITIYPQRTNNILEQFFRGERRAYRRKTGNDSMCRTLQTMLADTPLVRNLDNPNYMKMLLDGRANLEELFADLGKAHLPCYEGLKTDTARILPAFRALMNLSTLPDQVVRSLIKQVKMAKSN
jgi:hypothetical protein